MVDKFENSKGIKVFVYGTLMRGNREHENFLSEAQFAGNFVAEGFQLFDFGSYPRVIHSEIDKIKGELYIIDSKTLEKLDELEDEGNLYIRKLISVSNDNNEVQEAYTYVYNKNVPQNVKVHFENQSKVEIKRSDYVWYASYGSNMLYERFLTFIKGGYCKFNGVEYKGCRNTLIPKDSRPITIPYNMYYGNKSSIWGDAGVAFLDIESYGQALGRMHLVTWEQFEDILSQQERGENWYNQSVSLGEYNGMEIITFTNKSTRPCNDPADNYLEVIRMGIKETYPDMSDFDIMKYLVKCGLK